MGPPVNPRVSLSTPPDSGGDCGFLLSEGEAVGVMLGKQKSNMQYSEAEAARKLGLSVDQLRSLVREHIVRDPSEPVEMPVLQPTDLVLLRILCSMRQNTVN